MGTELQDNVLVVPAVKYQNLHFAVIIITPLLLATIHSKANLMKTQWIRLKHRNLGSGTSPG